MLFSLAILLAVAGIVMFATVPGFRSWFSLILLGGAGLVVAGVILRNQPPR